MGQLWTRKLKRSSIIAIWGVLSASTAVLSGQSVTSFTLWDVTNHSAPMPLSGYNPIAEGATIDLSTLPSSLAVTATTNPTRVGSVVFSYNGQTFHTENNDPQPSFNGHGQVGTTPYPKAYSFPPI